MSISEIENLIISKLKTVISDLEIAGYPDQPNTYNLIHPVGAALVHYNRSSFSESSGNYITQIRRMDFDIFLMVKNLRSENGAYKYLDTIHDALSGYGIDENKLFPVNEEFLSEHNGIWTYASRFVLKLPESLDY